VQDTFKLLVILHLTNGLSCPKHLQTFSQHKAIKVQRKITVFGIQYSTVWIQIRIRCSLVFYVV